MIPQKDGTILVLEGDLLAASISGEFYDPASATFGNAFSVSPVPGAHASSVLKDGRILFAGGWAPNGAGGFTTVATAQILDPQTRTLTPTGSMTAPRSSGTAVTLADGRVLVLGGSTSNNSLFPTLSTAEIYDPATGRFSVTGSLLESLIVPSAILLPNGKVLVAATNSSTAELYDPSTGEFSIAGQMPTPPPNGGTYRMFKMPNGTVMLNAAPNLPFIFYHS
jgi:Kelch motif